ncbi:MAG: hypothetical protein M3Z35_00160 [Nitrospirota bacterium]|nr:hypothetical protein [Nitrospirota bacterium]
MSVQRDDAAQAERIVMDYLQAHGPSTMERLVRALVGLSWAQVFSAVDRLSRTNKVHLRQTRERDYVVGMRAAFIPRHLLTQVITAKDRSTISD